MIEQSNQAKSIFLEAVEEHLPEQWPAFVEQACAGDRMLRQPARDLRMSRFGVANRKRTRRPPPSPFLLGKSWCAK
jgi:hypothetical protein